MFLITQSPNSIPSTPHVVPPRLTGHIAVHEQQTLSDLQRESMKAVDTTITLFALAALSPAGAFVPSAASRAVIGRSRGELMLYHVTYVRGAVFFMFLSAPPPALFV